MASQNVEVVIIARDRASQTLKGIGDESKRTGNKLEGIGGKFKKGAKTLAKGAAVTSAAIAGVGYAGLKAVKSAEKQETANKRLSQVLESMGYSDNAKAAIEYADSLEHVIAVDSAEIKAAQAKLATFDEVAKSQEKMQRATMIAADLAATGFGSMESASTMLGKALQDPIKGISSLTRVGVTFTDAEKDKIKALVESGKVTEAQNIIMGAMEKQVGGVAEATADASDKIGLSFGEITESIGGLLAPAVEKAVPIVKKFSDWAVSTLIPGLQRLGEKVMPVLKKVFEAVKDAIEENRPGLEKLWEIFEAIGEFVVDTLIPVLGKHLGKVLGALIKTMGWLGDTMPPIVSGFLRGIAQIIRGFAKFQDFLFDVYDAILGGAEKALGWIPGIGDKIKGARTAFTGFRDHTTGMMEDVAAGLDKTADKIDNIGKKKVKSKIEVDIAEAETEIVRLRRKLDDPDLTKKRRAKIEADISQLEQKVREGKSTLNSIKNKTVSITAGLYVSRVSVAQGVRNKLNAAGASILGLASGGYVTGPGTGTSDSVIRALSNGEYVMKAAAVKKFGVGFMEAVNAGSAPVAVARPAASSGGPDKVVVQMVVDGRVLHESLVDLKKRRGGSALGLE